MKKKIFKKVPVLLLTGFITLNSSGCNKEVEDVNVVLENSDDLENDSQTIEEVNNSDVLETEKIEDSKIDIGYYEQEDVVEYFINKKNNILNEELTDNVKKEAIDLFIEIVDFIFYDGKIYGITYKELKDEYKNNIIETFKDIDNFICTYSPNYKENLEQKYKDASNYIKEVYQNQKENFTENYGEITLEDVYNEFKEVNEKDKENISNLYDKAKTKTKNWYENLKNNN